MAEELEEERGKSKDSEQPPVDAPDSQGPDLAPSLLPFPIVAIGASAGGLEACRELLGNLPSDTGMAYVLISHLAPDQKSHLVEILGHNTQMKVLSVGDEVRPEPDHLYVLPPNSFVTVAQGRFRLEPRPGHVRIPMPIDHFFRSLAADQKTRAIGVILSGADSDGALGLKAIKGEGGITIVQAPESARHPGMPRSSIAADHVDVVLPPAQIGFELARLGRLFQRPELRRLDELIPHDGSEEQQLQRILLLLSSVNGIDFREYKLGTIQRRIARRMMLSRLPSLPDYLRYLQAHPEELRQLHEDVLISVTHFFRDPEVWQVFKMDILPQIFEGRPHDQQLRIWVPGCASGEEVYTIAICVLEFLSGRGIDPPIQIFGTDASERLVQAARLGNYPESIAEDVQTEHLRRFFIKAEKSYQISKRVRDLCIFARQNLCNDPPFSRLDMVSCRNVMIYFNQSLQRRIVPTFHYSLRPNGILLLGTSESLREYGDSFAPIDRRHKFYIKLPSASLINWEFPRRPPPNAGPDTIAETPVAPGRWSESELQRAADHIVLARYGPAGVVINERLEILQSRGHTGPFLEMAPGASSLNLLRMVRDSVAPHVREAVRRAMENDMPVQVGGIEMREGDRIGYLSIEVIPIQSLAVRGRCYLVLFLPDRRLKPDLEPLPGSEFTAGLPPDEKDRMIAQLQQDVQSSKLYLQSLIEERDIKNQDLVSANEEIQSSNEELQSANEELETTKEEVQSANEELQTVNDELQQRNQKLTQTSNDLNNLLNSVNIPVLMLSNQMEIRQFTPPTQKLINLREGDIGRPINEIRHNLTIDELRPIVQDVLDTLGTREMEVQDRDGRWYLMRVRPYRTSENKIEGAVLVLLEIDQLRRAQEELRASRDYADAIVESLQVPMVVLTPDLNIRTANGAFRALSAMGGADLDRRPFSDVAHNLWGIEGLWTELDRLRNTTEEGASFELERETDDPEPLYLSVRGRNIRYDSERAILLTIEDFTETRRAEISLGQEKTSLQAEIRSATEQLRRAQDELRALTASLFRSQEDESRHVARELHDDIGQKLAFLDMELQHAAEQVKDDPDDARRRIEALRQRAGSLSEEVRRISHRLHPSILDDLGLTHALRALVEDFGEREGMLATFSSRNVPDEVPHEISGVLYRIAQEGLRNVSKHAGKTHVKVTLDAQETAIRLEVSDLGEGFDPDGARRGLGLIGMAERARLIGGKLDVRSELGRGTTVVIEAPLPK